MRTKKRNGMALTTVQSANLVKVEHGTLLQATGHTYSLTRPLRRDASTIPTIHLELFSQPITLSKDLPVYSMHSRQNYENDPILPGKLFSVNKSTAETDIQVRLMLEERARLYFRTKAGRRVNYWLGAYDRSALETTWAEQVPPFNKT